MYTHYGLVCLNLLFQTETILANFKQTFCHSLRRLHVFSGAYVCLPLAPRSVASGRFQCIIYWWKVLNCRHNAYFMCSNQ